MNGDTFRGTGVMKLIWCTFRGDGEMKWMGCTFRGDGVTGWLSEWGVHLGVTGWWSEWCVHLVVTGDEVNGVYIYGCRCGEKKIKKKKKYLFKWKLFDITLSTYLGENSQNYLFRLKYNSDTSCRKGECVYKANFWYTIESTLIIRCKHSW